MMTKQPAADGRRLDQLSQDECLSRLALTPIGRLAVIVDHYPQVFPVNYRLDHEIVVFRTHIGTKLLAANHANVGFQVDHIDPGTHTGWSVAIEGSAEDVTDRTADPIAERSRNLDIDPWAPGDKPRIVRIIPVRMTGVELTPGNLGFWSEDAGYL